MTRRERALLIDVAIACLIAVLVVVVSPGLAVVALVALATLIVVSLSLALGFLRDRWLARRRRYSSVSPAPPTAGRSRPRSRPGR
jgi:ABC-type bacteriocin/lantibiotic exporter with double-glycine peptidase domain